MLIKIEPWSRINDTINWSDSIDAIKKLYPVDSICYDNLANDIQSRYQFKDIQKSFLYVCTETVFQYPHAYLTEKSYKGITAKRPFVIVGAPGSIDLLKSYGFKTFDRWWDEDYDNEQNPNRRIEKIFAIIEYISSKTTIELQDMITEMSELLDYNFSHYSTFANNEINQFESACRSNLTRNSHVQN